MKTNDHDAETAIGTMTDICPVSGLKITRKPEWTNIPLTEAYTVTFEIIGDRILYTIPFGICGDEGVAALFNAREKVIRHMIGAGGKCVELRNYAGVRDRPNRAARKQMVRGVRSGADFLLGMIVFNVPPVISIVARMGMRLYRFPFHVSIAADYAEAVTRALDLLGRNSTGGHDAETLSEVRGASGADDAFKPYVDELVNYIGRINWENDEIATRDVQGDGHPFQPVFEAIDLLKVDLDDLINEREQTLKNLLERNEEHRRTEEALMMFRRFAEASGEGLGWSDLDGRIVYVNQTMCRILGETDPATAVGRPVTSYYDRETRRKLVHEITPQIMKQGEWKGELLLKRENGEQLPTLNDLFLIRDETGQPLYHAIIAQDISDLKRAEQALKKSEEQYRVLYEYAGDAIFVAQDGVIKFPNLKGQAMFGYNREELAKDPFLERIHPEDRQMVLERYARRLKGDASDQTYSFRIFNKAGEMIWVQITSVPIEWEGRPGALIFMRDITHLKTMEEQLRQKYKMEAVGTLAGGIAHDFNNILAGIMGYTDVIAGQTPSDTAAYRNLTQIRKAVMRARGLVKQLLAFSRSAEQDYSAVDMGPIVSEALEMIRAMAPPSVTVEEKIMTNGCMVYANPVQIHAIVLNLCHNAFQAMADGGTLEVVLDKTDPEPIPMDGAVSDAFANRYCRLVVRDTGKGMTTDVRERVFEPYFTTRPPGQGTGLGLSVVHGVVTNLGGTITVESNPGAGTTFRILFPVMKGAGK
ncbi:MAG: PAS domain S-box protein [Thermodesulfobacteriota bacterium]